MEIWQEAVDHVKDLTSNPENFLDPSNCEADFIKAKLTTKLLYDAAKLIERESLFGKNNGDEGKVQFTYSTPLNGSDY